MLNDELVLAILRQVDKADTQKSLAKKLGISVGKANYALNALIDKGLIKVERFIHSENKRGYVYLLTSKGFKVKIELIERFVEIKKQEYEELIVELKRIKKSSDFHKEKEKCLMIK